MAQLRYGNAVTPGSKVESKADWVNQKQKRKRRHVTCRLFLYASDVFMQCRSVTSDGTVVYLMSSARNASGMRTTAAVT